ncbi:MAG: DNA primase [Verrucomicrobiae bacterium]|nr:DNA primase [Verrucomicrobiae bacterium]
MAGSFPQNNLEQIRAASEIVDVIGSYLPLKRAGANFVALCPFHKEKSPSFHVNPQRQIFHCFGCHKGGDVFTFVKEYENIGFMDAVRRLAERAKIPLEFGRGEPDQATRHLKDQLLQIHEQITQRWQNCLANEAAGQLARDYLAQRGVSAEAIKLFRLGAAPEAWDDTVNWAKSKSCDLTLMEQAGLILKKEETGRHYDRFRGRLMFPICDEQGRVIAFSGRVLAGDEKTAKYVNSPETPIFTKSKVFFGLDKSKRAVLDAGFALVCEGQLDLIACYMAGVQNVVAPQGTAFTADHARILKRYVDEVVLCFDSDEAGQNAATRSLDSLLASGLAVRVAVVPSPHDPDSFIKEHGPDAFRQLVEKAAGFFDYYLNRLCARHDLATDKGRLAVVRGMAEAVRKTGNTVLLDKHAQTTALRLGVSPEAVRAEFQKHPTARTALVPAEDSFEEPETAAARPSAPEFWLLKLVMLYEAELDWVAAHLDPDWIQHPEVQHILRRRLAAHENRTWRGLAAFLDEFEAGDAQNLITEASAEEREIPDPARQLNDLVMRLRNQFLDRQLAALTHRSSLPEIGEAERLELLRQQQRLRQLKRQPLNSVGEGG